MALSKVKVFYNGRNEEHKVFSFEVAALPNTDPEEYDEAMREIIAWCKDTFPQPEGVRRKRFMQVQWVFWIGSKTDATAFRLRWC